MNIKTDSRAILFARLFLYPKLNAFTENTRKNHFFRMLYRELLRFIAFRHFRCSTVRNFIREVILYKDKVVITFNFTDQHITKKRLPDSIEEVERTAKQAEKSASKNKSGV